MNSSSSPGRFVTPRFRYRTVPALNRYMAWWLLAVLLLGLTNFRPVNAADFFNGRQIYEVHCQSCHGIDGRSMEPGTPDFSIGDTLFRPDADLVREIRDGKGTMPAYRGLLTDAEIRDVVAYLRSLQ